MEIIQVLCLIYSVCRFEISLPPQTGAVRVYGSKDCATKRELPGKATVNANRTVTFGCLPQIIATLKDDKLVMVVGGEKQSTVVKVETRRGHRWRAAAEVSVVFTHSNTQTCGLNGEGVWCRMDTAHVQKVDVVLRAPNGTTSTLPMGMVVVRHTPITYDAQLDWGPILETGWREGWGIDCLIFSNGKATTHTVAELGVVVHRQTGLLVWFGGISMSTLVVVALAQFVILYGLVLWRMHYMPRMVEDLLRKLQ